MRVLPVDRNRAFSAMLRALGVLGGKISLNRGVRGGCKGFAKERIE